MNVYKKTSSKSIIGPYVSIIKLVTGETIISRTIEYKKPKARHSTVIVDFPLCVEADIEVSLNDDEEINNMEEVPIFEPWIPFATKTVYELDKRNIISMSPASKRITKQYESAKTHYVAELLRDDLDDIIFQTGLNKDFPDAEIDAEIRKNRVVPKNPKKDIPVADENDIQKMVEDAEKSVDNDEL